jgi:flagellar basal body-associated protein FliL
MNNNGMNGQAPSNGKSKLPIIIGAIFAVVLIAAIVVIVILSSKPKKTNKTTNTATVINTIPDPADDITDQAFYKDFVYSFNANWTYESSKTPNYLYNQEQDVKLVLANVFAHNQETYTVSADLYNLLADMSTEDGLQKIFDFIKNDFDQLAQQANLEATVGSKTFTKSTSEDIYYTYIDVTKNGRFYIVLEPTTHTLFQFNVTPLTQTNMDTYKVSDTAHKEIIKVLETIYYEGDIVDNNTTTNTTSNEVSNSTTNNTSNEVSNNTASNETNTTNTTNETSNTTANTTNETNTTTNTAN